MFSLVVIGFFHLSLNIAYLSLNKNNILDGIWVRDKRHIPLYHPFEFAACLIIKDGNQILPEWLAYHYTVLPLRRLIVAVDPFSLTSPEPVLEKFRDIGMNITLWTDKDYFPKDIKYWQVPPGPERNLHALIQREQTFYGQCLKKFRDENNSSKANHTWVGLISSDEFIIFNYFTADEGEPHRCESRNETSTHECYNTFLRHLEEGIVPRARLPSLGKETVAHFISKEVGKDPLWRFPCVVLPRVNFGPLQNALQDLHQPSVPTGFQNQSFQTLHFFNHGPKKNQWPGKSIVDISRFNQTKIDNVHIASYSMCNNGWGAGWGVQHYADSPLRVHHYIDAFERYMARAGDYGRDEAHFKKKIKGITPDRKDYSMVGWLHAFVNIFGKNRALELTEKLQRWAEKDDSMARKKFKENKGNFRYQFFDPDDYQKYLDHEKYLANLSKTK